jgi:CBS domain-containing protein
MQDGLRQPRTPMEHGIMVDPITMLHSPAPESVSPQASLAEVVRRMRETNVGYVLVVDAAGKLIGIFTERDLLCKVAGQVTDLGATPVSQWMTPNPTALRATEPIKHALFLMAHYGFRHVPLVDDDERPHGIATVRHVIDYIEQISLEAG